MLFNMKGRPLIVLLRFSFIKDFIFKIIERLSCVDVKGLRCLCYEDHQGNQWETVLRSWTSTSSACEYCACVLVTRVLPVLASTVLVYLWLEYFQCLRWKSSPSCVHGSEGGKTRAAASCGDRHPPREEESPLLHRLDFLSFLLLLHRLGQSAVNSKFLPFACLPHPEHLNRGDDWHIWPAEDREGPAKVV